jgi:hypothetical protein
MKRLLKMIVAMLSFKECPSCTAKNPDSNFICDRCGAVLLPLPHSVTDPAAESQVAAPDRAA